MRASTSAFTLVELLVVIAIIALLIGILLPALGAAKESGRNVACLSNLSQIGRGVMSYVTDYNGFWPQSSHSTGNNTSKDAWLQSLVRYGVGTDLRKCPSDPNGHLTTRRTSYTLTDQIAPLMADYDYDSVTGDTLIRGKAYTRIDDIPRPSSTIFAVEAADGAGTVDHLHTALWTSPLQMAGAIAVRRHRDSANYLFMDGHASSIPWSAFSTFNATNSPFNPETAR